MMKIGIGSQFQSVLCVLFYDNLNQMDNCQSLLIEIYQNHTIPSILDKMKGESPNEELISLVLSLCLLATMLIVPATAETFTACGVTTSNAAGVDADGQAVAGLMDF